MKRKLLSLRLPVELAHIISSVKEELPVSYAVTLLLEIALTVLANYIKMLRTRSGDRKVALSAALIDLHARLMERGGYGLLKEEN